VAQAAAVTKAAGDEVAPPKTAEIKLASPPSPCEIEVHLSGDENTRVRIDFAEHVRQFSTGLPPLAWAAGAVERARGMRGKDADPWPYELPFTAAEPWSPTNYLRRLLYHLTQGRISYYLDAETKRQRGGSYAIAGTTAAMQMNTARLDVRHPITFSDESFFFEWPAALGTPFVAAQGGLYFTQRRCLFVADQAWATNQQDQRPPLPFLSFWSQLELGGLLAALGAKGALIWVEKRKGMLPKRLSPRTWLEPLVAWRPETGDEILSITGWSLDLVFVDGQRGGDGAHAPSPDQDWMFLGYRVRRLDGRQEFVAMIPHFVVPRNPQVRKGIEAGFRYLQSQVLGSDALELIAFADVARQNGLLHNADLVDWPVPLQDAPPI